MSRIKNNLTGDVFEGPARDFANEADFAIVDSSTPITAEPPVAVSAPGESGTPASAPAEQASSGTTDTPADTPSSAPTSTQTDASQSTTPTADVSTITPDGTAPSSQGDLGNADASTSPAGAATDATTAGDPLTLNPTQPPVTDSATGNPTGGPTPGNGATLDARGKHIVADQLEADMLFAIAQIITPTDSLKHAADAFFDQVRSQIDVESI